jgi:dsRNA-specific ribonuclease
MMSHTGGYKVEIEPRVGGAPKFQVSVTLDGKQVGEDYAGSVRQAEELAKRMIQRHQELHRQLGSL